MKVRLNEKYTDEQVRWGGCSNPEGRLSHGTTYDVERVEVRSWHTKLHIEDDHGDIGTFNSVIFHEVTG